GDTDGFVRVWCRRGSDRILGATIVGSQAGELIAELVLAMHRRIGLGQLGGSIHSYPTRAEAVRRLGDAYQRTRLTPLAAWILRTLLKWQ
ncbi:MAG: FAD-containing oxidoreductase, partial [Planctomycetales bacterium]|nr:FAD-containing oxidoreductase [Planctomycetales bacterium]